MDKLPEWRDEADIFWLFRDERMANLVEHKYADRQKFAKEAEQKRKALEKMDSANPLYHRAAVSAEMAQLRFEMSYLVERNRNLAQYIETLEYLHQKVGILEGAYGHIKMLAESCKNDYLVLYRKLNPPKEK